MVEKIERPISGEEFLRALEVLAERAEDAPIRPVISAGVRNESHPALLVLSIVYAEDDRLQQIERQHLLLSVPAAVQLSRRLQEEVEKYLHGPPPDDQIQGYRR